jgi:hypothetical protein
MTTEQETQSVRFLFFAEHVRQGLGARLGAHQTGSGGKTRPDEVEDEEIVVQTLDFGGKVAVFGDLKIVDRSEGLKELPKDATVEVKRSESTRSTGRLSCSLPMKGTENLYHAWMLKVSLSCDVFDKLWECLPLGAYRRLEMTWEARPPSIELDSFDGGVDQISVERVNFSLVTKEEVGAENDKE